MTHDTAVTHWKNPAQVDWLQTLIILICFGLVLWSPVVTFFVSIIFIGPAHYITQLVWLNDRRYFVPGNSHLLWVLVPVGLIGVFYDEYLVYVTVFTISIALAVILFTRLWQQLVFATLSFAAILLMRELSYSAMIFVLFFPTLVHVALFTSMFILYGALKNNHTSGYVAFITFIAVLVGCFLVPTTGLYSSPPYVMHTVQPMWYMFISLTKTVYGEHFTSAQMEHAARFISLAYTYHYLNWFTKTGIIRWNAGYTRKRLIVIVGVYVASIVLYVLQARVGISMRSYLSLMHGVLELPLDFIACREIGRLLYRRLGHQTA